MQDTQEQLPALAEYVALPALLPIVESTFPTRYSLQWFIRQHRDELIGARALIDLAGRLRFHPRLFQSVAVEIGLASAGRRSDK